MKVQNIDRKQQALRWGLALALIAVATGFRLMDHLPNFTPVLAIAVFAGAIFSRKVWALGIVFTAMIIPDLVLGFHSSLPVVYLCMAMLVFVGASLKPQKRNAVRVLGTLGSGAVLFFVITNFAVWAGGAMYPKNLSGLIECYVMAVPFFRATLSSTLLFGSGLFGLWTLAAKTWAPAFSASAPR